MHTHTRGQSSPLSFYKLNRAEQLVKLCTYEMNTSIVSTIKDQLIATAGISVLFSWGINSLQGTIINNMAALTFLVQGFDFTGRIWVAYNECADTYQVFGQRNGQRQPSCLIEETYCDTFADQLDKIIETGPKGQKIYGNK